MNTIHRITNITKDLELYEEIEDDKLDCKQERIEPTMGSFLFVANNDFISLFLSYTYLK